MFFVGFRSQQGISAEVVYVIVIAFLFSEVIFTFVGETKSKNPAGSQTYGLFMPVALLIVVLRNLARHWVRKPVQFRINIDQVKKFAARQGYEKTPFLCYESFR